MTCPRCHAETSILTRDIATGLCHECMKLHRQEMEAAAAQDRLEREEADRIEEQERKARVARWRQTIKEKAEATISRTVTPCVKCGEIKRIESLPISGAESHPIEICIDEMPSATLFKDRTRHKLTAAVCGHCGYTELYIESPERFWNSFTASIFNAIPSEE